MPTEREGRPGGPTVGVASPPTREELALALAGAMDESATKALDHAEALHQQAERLHQDATRLTKDANLLLAGAEALGLDVGETAGEVEQVADHGTTVNGRGEKVTFELARDAAARLGRFNRERFGEDLALKPIIAMRWIARLREAAFLDAEDHGDGEVIYDYRSREAGSGDVARERHEPPEVRAARLEAGRNGRGGPVEGAGKRAAERREAQGRPGRRRPGRR